MMAQKDSITVAFRLVRWQVHRVVDNIFVRLFGLLLVIVDVILVFVRLSETGWKLNADDEPPVRYRCFQRLTLSHPDLSRGLRQHLRVSLSTL
jgi:hypothetical protein